MNLLKVGYKEMQWWLSEDGDDFIHIILNLIKKFHQREGTKMLLAVRDKEDKTKKTEDIK